MTCVAPRSIIGIVLTTSFSSCCQVHLRHNLLYRGLIYLKKNSPCSSFTNTSFDSDVNSRPDIQLTTMPKGLQCPMLSTFWTGQNLGHNFIHFFFRHSYDNTRIIIWRFLLSSSPFPLKAALEILASWIIPSL